MYASALERDSPELPGVPGARGTAHRDDEPGLAIDLAPVADLHDDDPAFAVVDKSPHRHMPAGVSALPQDHERSGKEKGDKKGESFSRGRGHLHDARLAEVDEPGFLRALRISSASAA